MDVITDRVILGLDVSNAAKVALLHFRFRVLHGEVQVRSVDLAKVLGVGQRQARRVIDELIDAGVIKEVHRGRTYHVVYSPEVAA